MLHMLVLRMRRAVCGRASGAQVSVVVCVYSITCCVAHTHTTLAPKRQSLCIADDDDDASLCVRLGALCSLAKCDMKYSAHTRENFVFKSCCHLDECSSLSSIPSHTRTRPAKLLRAISIQITSKVQKFTCVRMASHTDINYFQSNGLFRIFPSQFTLNINAQLWRSTERRFQSDVAVIERVMTDLSIFCRFTVNAVNVCWGASNNRMLASRNVTGFYVAKITYGINIFRLVSSLNDQMIMQVSDTVSLEFYADYFMCTTCVMMVCAMLLISHESRMR